MKSKETFHETVKRVEDGKTVVGVLLSNSPLVAWVMEDDYTRIISTYGISSWFLNSSGNGYSYVRIVHNGNNVQVARLVLGDHRKANVRLLDRNPCNLRRSNLYFGAARGGGERVRNKEPKANPLGSGLRILVGGSHA